MRTPWFLVVVSLAVLLGGLVVGSGEASAQTCEAIGSYLNNGCETSCQTTLSLTCESLGADCEGCCYEVWAAIMCPPGSGTSWHIPGNLECGGGYERRFAGCGTGEPAWGSVDCECEACP